MTARAMHKLLNKIDVNQDGEISRQEFLDFYKRAKEEGGDEIIDIAKWAMDVCVCLAAHSPSFADSRPLWKARTKTTMHLDTTSTRRLWRGASMRGGLQSGESI